MKYRKFEELPIWKESIDLTKYIYDLSSSGKWAKDFGLRDQIRRAIISISSNIVEGFEKSNNNELIRYLRIAKGSAGEVRNQLHIAQVLSYISRSEFESANQNLNKLAADIGGFIVYLEGYRKTQSAIRNLK